MPSTIRLKKSQQGELSKKFMEINKTLINKGIKPVSEADLIHLIIDDGLRRVGVDKHNRICIKNEQEKE